MISDKYVVRLKKIALAQSTSLKEIETNHADADEILCELLKELGYSEIVQLYESIEKIYAKETGMTNRELAEYIDKNKIAATKYILGQITLEELKQAPDTRDNIRKINTIHNLLSDRIKAADERLRLSSKELSLELQIEKEIGYDRDAEMQKLAKSIFKN